MIDTQKLVFFCGALVVVLFIYRALIKKDLDAGSQISLDDLLIGDDGKLSRAACVLMGSFILSVLIMGYLTITGGLTEGYFGTFLAAWVAPTVTKLIVNRSDPVQMAAKANESQQIQADVDIARAQQ